MKRPAICVGAKVEFKSWVFNHPAYAPYFLKYKDLVFKISDKIDDHYLLKCISDPEFRCDGGFHLEQLKVAKK